MGEGQAGHGADGADHDRADHDGADHDRADGADGADERALAPAYRTALRLEAAGHDHAVIAAALDLQVEAVPTLLVLARRKRARAARPAAPDSEEAGA